MTETKFVKNRHQDRRDAALAQLGPTGPFLEGHLSAFKRPGCAQPGWHLTFKQKGKTRTVYVPMDLVDEVKLWTQNFQRLKQIIRQVTRHSLAMIRSHVASRRAAGRGRASTKRKAPKA
jgi:hypothetical protein